MFGLYTSTINGKAFRLILGDTYREMNHARVSPDGTMITFSRFNTRKGWSRLAEEKNGYFNTEIMIACIDGTKVESLTPPQEYIINVNSYWTPDGKGIIYMSNDNPNKRQLTIKRIDLKTRETTVLSPTSLPWVTDPHQVDTSLVFPGAKNPDTDPRSIWSINLNNQQLQQITRPNIAEQYLASMTPPPGDSDPKLSPDSSKIAFTRHPGDGSFLLFIHNLATGEERNYSQPGAVDVMPEWSSDGKYLTFWHVNLQKLSDIGVYVLKSDGSLRRKVPLPSGFHFKMPAFFPGDGSGPEARIIFTGKRVPQIK